MKNINGLNIDNIVKFYAATYEDYISDVIMHFEMDVQGFLFYFVPLVLKINVHLVKINSQAECS